MNKKHIDNLARTLAETRAEVALLNTHKEDTKSLLDDSGLGRQFAGAIKELRAAKGMMSSQHQDLASALVEMYTGVPKDEVEKHPATHQIRRSVIAVYTESDAKQYCMEKHPEFLALDQQKFEAFAKKSGAELDFVDLREVLSVTIKGDLTEFISEPVG